MNNPTTFVRNLPPSGREYVGGRPADRAIIAVPWAGMDYATCMREGWVPHILAHIETMKAEPQGIEADFPSQQEECIRYLHNFYSFPFKAKDWKLT